MPRKPILIQLNFFGSICSIFLTFRSLSIYELTLSQREIETEGKNLTKQKFECILKKTLNIMR